MQYPIFIHKDKNSSYGVTIPDLPGCFSAGDTIEEAIKNSHEAIECHLEGLLIDGDPLPKSKPIDQHLKNKNLKNSVLAMIEIDITKISGKSKRVDITLPERLLNQIDKYTKHFGSNRSAFIAESAMQFIAMHKFTHD